MWPLWRLKCEYDRLHTNTASSLCSHLPNLSVSSGEMDSNHTNSRFGCMNEIMNTWTEFLFSGWHNKHSASFSVATWVLLTISQRYHGVSCYIYQNCKTFLFRMYSFAQQPSTIPDQPHSPYFFSASQLHLRGKRLQLSSLLQEKDYFPCAGSWLLLEASLSTSLHETF